LVGASGSSRTPPVVFDDAAWDEDLRRASEAAVSTARAARTEFEARGVIIDRLKACSPEGDDATELLGCLKVYLPAPDGPHGMVFEIVRIDGRSRLLFAAFGQRHPPHDSRQPSVYQVAHRRLHPPAAPELSGPGA